MQNLDSFTLGYITAALWSSTGDNDEPLDRDHSIADLAPEALARMVADCTSFQAKAGTLIDSKYLLIIPDRDTDGTFGHDFWLTRNGHGSGYWDTTCYRKSAGEKLDKLAKSFGQCDLYVGDDGRIYS
jgi:hypothetical protein